MSGCSEDLGNRGRLVELYGGVLGGTAVSNEDEFGVSDVWDGQRQG